MEDLRRATMEQGSASVEASRLLEHARPVRVEGLADCLGAGEVS